MYIKPIHYVANLQDYGKPENTFELGDDYSVLIMINSRFAHVIRDIYPIIYLLDSLDEEHTVTELQLWWLSLRRMLFNDVQLNEIELRLLDNKLTTFFYNTCFSFLKYDIIDSIKTDRKVLLYGDTNLGKLFPQYYQKYLEAEEKHELISKEHLLYITMNFNYYYPEVHPAVNDALFLDVPFLCCPALVKTPPYSGFRHIEYGNAGELNCLINEGREKINNPEVKTSIRNFKELMKASLAEMAENIMFDKALPADGGIYLRECEENRAVLDEMIGQYMKEKGEFLKTSFENIFMNKPVQFDPSKTRYYGKDYVQKILAAKNEMP
ncbi:MAG: hypothetical protein HQL08_06310 [Nitrospirae bacterium]|nr:hypothetical protein [Nitrospirota bacterium]